MPDDTAPPAELLRTRDILGREVVGADGRKAGTIKDLLLARDGSRTHFLALDLGLFKNQVLVPVDEVEPGATGFVLRRWTAEDLQALPAYQPDRPLTAALLAEMATAHPRRYGDLRAAGVAPPSGDGVVLPLKQARKFRLAEGAPDLRGWNVFGADGERVGVVTELLVQPTAGKVRYLDVDLMEDLFSLAEDRHVLVPLEAVSLKERGRDIWFEDAPADIVKRLPAYTGGEPDLALLERVDAVFAQAASRGAPLADVASPGDEGASHAGPLEPGRGPLEPGPGLTERGRLPEASPPGELPYAARPPRADDEAPRPRPDDWPT
ncbi:MAG: PRC-barrel domain-containing protein [Gemmatimonadetes bacterium]|nr:PRC-barrel domain-containing protein [Gemmatimonadota bacterium]